MPGKKHRTGPALQRASLGYSIDINDLQPGQSIEMFNGFRWIHYRILYMDEDTVLLEQPKEKVKITIFKKHLAFYHFR